MDKFFVCKKKVVKILTPDKGVLQKASFVSKKKDRQNPDAEQGGTSKSEFCIFQKKGRQNPDAGDKISKKISAPGVTNPSDATEGWEPVA